MEEEHKEETIETKNESAAEEKPVTDDVEEIEKAIVNEEKPKKTGAGCKIMAAFFFVATLGLSGFLVYHYMNFDHSPKAPEEKKNEPVAQQTEEKTEKKDKDGNTVTSTTVTSVVVSSDAADTAVRNTVKELFAVAHKMAGGKYITIYDTISPIIKLDEAKILLRAEKSYGIDAPYSSSLDNQLNKEIGDALASKLSELGFAENNEISGPSFIVGGKYFTNTSTDVTCVITNNIPVTAACSHKSWIAADTVKIANELAEAYYKKKGNYPIAINASYYTIKDSPVSPYQTLTTTVENAAGLFYRVDKEAEWQFFQGTQAVLDCADYDTKDVRNAFAGEECWDNTTGSNSTVSAWEEE